MALFRVSYILKTLKYLCFSILCCGSNQIVEIKVFIITVIYNSRLFLMYMKALGNYVFSAVVIKINFVL